MLRQMGEAPVIPEAEVEAELRKFPWQREPDAAAQDPGTSHVADLGEQLGRQENRYCERLHHTSTNSSHRKPPH